MRLPDLGRKLARRGAGLPASLVLHGMNVPPVLAYLERRHARAASRHARAATLSEAEAAIVAGLERDGVFVSNLDALGLADAGEVEGGENGILRAGARVADVLARRVAAMAGPSPVMIMTRPADIVGAPVLYRWGLHAALLRVAEAYLGLPVAYDGPVLFHTPADGVEAGTRMWHLDQEDRRVIKVALYLHDVDAQGGPFQSLRRPARAPGERFDFHPLDAAGLWRKFGVAEDAPDITTCVGGAGTLIFADTARFYHRGKPATRRARSAIFYSYFASPPRHPFFCDRARLARRDIADMVKDLPPHQRACALWRDRLPWLARVVPSSPV